MKKKSEGRSMTVKSKLMVFSGLMLGLILIIALASSVVVSRVNKERSDRYTIYGERELKMCDSLRCFNQIRVLMRDAIYIYPNDKTQQENIVKEINEGLETIKTQLASVSEVMDSFSQDFSDQFKQMATYLTEYNESVEKTMDMVTKGDIRGAEQELTVNAVDIASNARASFKTALNTLIQDAAQESKNIDRTVLILTIILSVICGISLLIGIIYCVVLIRAITHPIEKLSIASKKLAEGDIEVDCEKIANDDLGALMDGYKGIVEDIKQQVKMAEAIADGDLTAEVHARSDKDVLRKAIRKLIEHNNVNIGNIKESTMHLTIGAEQVASASQSLAQGSTEQASALEQVTASMAEIAERTKNNASQANEADELVHNVKRIAEDGNGQMTSMINAMNDINASSETISKIIKTIDDISFQTNILALNAAVEAARAGVHGKGFAVVAEEVRSLAAKSASAASETAEMIEDSIQKVSNGSRIADETAKSLSEIIESIDKIVELISQIAVASNDQATAVSQIDQAIGQVSTVVQTNSATSQQCAAASEELSNQAENLKEVVANYKLAVGYGGGNYASEAKGMDNYSSNNEQIISLDGEFGKY